MRVSDGASILEERGRILKVLGYLGVECAQKRHVVLVIGLPRDSVCDLLHLFGQFLAISIRIGLNQQSGPEEVLAKSGPTVQKALHPFGISNGHAVGANGSQESNCERALRRGTELLCDLITWKDGLGAEEHRSIVIAPTNVTWALCPVQECSNRTSGSRIPNYKDGLAVGLSGYACLDGGRLRCRYCDCPSRQKTQDRTPY